MDGIIGLGHFCETHGPCVVLATQRYTDEPTQKPHGLHTPRCEACESLAPDRAYLTKYEAHCYITTRTPLQQEDAFLLRQATVRALSCEQEGTVYFGDNERGHVYAHAFAVHDTYARGFQRKYAIMVLTRNKLALLNAWRAYAEHVQMIAADLAARSEAVNRDEQRVKSQKSLRQAEGSPSNVARSLVALTGSDAIYAQLHLWFAWMLGCPVVEEDCSKLPTKSLAASRADAVGMRQLYSMLGEAVFEKLLGWFLHGAIVECEDTSIMGILRSLWPDFKQNLGVVRLYRKKNVAVWEIDTKLGVLSKSRLQKDIENLLVDKRISDNTLEHQINALVMTWMHNATVLVACPQLEIGILNSLNVTKNDVPLLSYLISSQCNKDRAEQVIAGLETIYRI